MTRSRAFRTVLVMLLVSLHLGGFSASAPTTRSPAAASYSCCCVGECHCTGDCCNHPPTTAGNGSETSVRRANGEPRWRSPRSCGGWQVTVTRGPGQLEPMDAARCSWTPQAATTDQSLTHQALDLRSDSALRASTPPRAPPILLGTPATA